MSDVVTDLGLQVEVHPDWWWVARMELAGFVYSPMLTNLVWRVATRFRNQGNGQHIIHTTHVYINPKVASLPEHAHLMGMLGCFSPWPDANGTVDSDSPARQSSVCEKADGLPARFLPVHRTGNFDIIVGLAVSPAFLSPMQFGCWLVLESDGVTNYGASGTPSHFDHFTLEWDFGRTVGGSMDSSQPGEKGEKDVTEFNLGLTNDPGAKCRARTWPATIDDDGCAHTGKPFDEANLDPPPDG